MDNIPVPLKYPELNITNHLACISYALLGPADPREPSTKYWNQLQKVWGVPEGIARSRLCMNCAHYNNAQEVLDAFKDAPGAKVLASDLPITPKWADIVGMPSAVCARWNITCSALRTCADWEDPLSDPDNVNVRFVSPEDNIEND